MTTTDLTTERLDELVEQTSFHGYPPPMSSESFRALIAMARAKLAAERERDEWKAKFEAVRQSESDALARNDALTFIAGSNSFQRDKAERERDVLRLLLDDWLGACTEYYNIELMKRTEAALAQPTDAGGAE